MKMVEGSRIAIKCGETIFLNELIWWQAQIFNVVK